MAARLEAVISSRTRNRDDKKWLLKSLLTDQKQEEQDVMLESPKCLRAGWSSILGEIDGAPYEKFFMNLKTTLLDDSDPVKSLQNLNHTRSIARELVSR